MTQEPKRAKRASKETVFQTGQEDRDQRQKEMKITTTLGPMPLDSRAARFLETRMEDS